MNQNQVQPAPEVSCLTCRHLDQPEATHNWHLCLWSPVCLPNRVLPSWFVWRVNDYVSIEEPYRNCQAWEARGA